MDNPSSLPFDWQGQQERQQGEPPLILTEIYCKKKKTQKLYLQESKKLKPEPTSNHSGTPIEDSERDQAEELNPPSAQTAHLSTLLKMVNDLNTNNITASSIIQEEPKSKPIEYEGRGTVKCHI